MKTFGNKVSGSCQTLTTLLSKKHVNVRFEILSAVLMKVRLWYVRRVTGKSFGRSAGAYCPLFGIKQSKKFDLFSVLYSRRRVTFPEDLNLQNLPLSILI